MDPETRFFHGKEPHFLKFGATVFVLLIAKCCKKPSFSFSPRSNVGLPTIECLGQMWYSSSVITDLHQEGEENETIFDRSDNSDHPTNGLCWYADA